MAYPRPTLKQLIDRNVAAITGKLSLSTPALSRAVSTIIAYAVAGASHGLHGYGDWLWRQIFPSEADIESVEKEAAGYGIYRNAAVFSTGTWTVTGTNGTIIPANTEWTRADGTRYISTAAATVASGTATITGQAVVAGADGDLTAGTVLTISTPIANVSTTATVVALTGGADAEEAEDFRTRFLEFLAAESEIGTDADYIRWAKTVTGVTRVWIYRHENGLGTVVVRFVRDNNSITIIPDSGEVAAVQAALNAERPTTADVTAAAPNALVQAFTISITAYGDTPERRTAIESQLKDLFFRRAAPGDGAGRGTITLSEVRTAIGVIAPIYTLTTPSADLVPAVGQLLTLGTITWV